MMMMIFVFDDYLLSFSFDFSPIMMSMIDVIEIDRDRITLCRHLLLMINRRYHAVAATS